MRIVADPDSRFPPDSAYMERAVLAQVYEAAGVYPAGADVFLQNRYPNDLVSRALLTRSTATISTTSNQSAVLATAFGAFLKSLTPFSAAAELIKRGITVDIAGSGSFPARPGNPVAAPWVAEGEPIPVATHAFGLVTMGTPRKIALLSVITRELARRSDAEAAVIQVLRENVGLALDAGYLSTTAGSAAAHAGLLYGVSPIAGMPGGDLAAITTDLAQLAAAVSTGGSGQVVFIMSPANAATLPIKAPEIAARVTLLASQALADSRIVAVDPLSLVHATDPLPDIEAAAETVLHMSDAPLEVVSDAGTVADPVRSMFQTAGIAIRIMANVSFAKRRTGAVAYINDAAW